VLCLPLLVVGHRQRQEVSLVHQEYSQVEHTTAPTQTRAAEQGQGRMEQTARQVEEVMVEMVFQAVFQVLRPITAVVVVVDFILDQRDLAG
jgi:hypothetical protein